ncbi:MAG: transketolase [Spirochaetes bacterium]|nr:transketolase [Spirochaetota bacterium]
MASIDTAKARVAGDYIRYLSLFGVESAKSGHPGLPLGCADIGVLLYRYFLTYNIDHPKWINRDRFVLSAGHGSMLLYSLLHTAGYNISLADLGQFRQLGSKTPGHPEYDVNLGIETTTGPLGQGFANAVGIALEGKMLAAKFNKEGFPLFTFNAVTLMGDGCNMEGVSYEAASVAGHLGLDNLIAIYDSNKITIDGSTDISFTEDVGKRYEAQGWHVVRCKADDIDCLAATIESVKKVTGKPKLCIVTTTIGEGLDKLRGSNKVHGAPAGIDEIVYFIQNSTMRPLFEKKLGTADSAKLKEIMLKALADRKPPVESDEVYAFVREHAAETTKAYNTWEDMLEQYKSKYAADYQALEAYMSFSIPPSLRDKLIHFTDEKPDATRNISGRVLNLCAAAIPQIVGGSADLIESTKATIKNSPYVTKDDFSGRNIAFGIREHAMGSIGNGVALNGTTIPFTSTFFTFFDYMKPSVRLAAIMKIKHLFIFTHDSIYVGEDGPTHQPIEHLNALRLIPDLTVFRPANDVETAFSYLYFLEEAKGPVAVICTRQNIEDLAYRYGNDREKLYDDFKKGGYIIQETEANNRPDIILAASGSEVGLALAVTKLIEQREGKKVRVVSIPSLENFADSDATYRSFVLGDGDIPTVFIEAASHRGVKLFYGKNIRTVTIEEFGHSGPAKKVSDKLGFTADSVYAKIKG